MDKRASKVAETLAKHLIHTNERATEAGSDEKLKRESRERESRERLENEIIHLRKALDSLEKNSKTINNNLRSAATESAWLAKTLRLYLNRKSSASFKVVGMVLDDLSGDLTSKCFNLETLVQLNNRYLNDPEFGWFINSNLKVMNVLIPHNPFYLITEVIDISGTTPNHLTSELLDVGGMIPGIPTPAGSFTPWQVSSKEYAIMSSVGWTDKGLYFLYKRPWLTRYLISLVLFQLHQDLQTLFEEYEQCLEEFQPLTENSEGGTGTPNPDNLSTQIPVPDMSNSHVFGGFPPPTNQLTPL